MKLYVGGVELNEMYLRNWQMIFMLALQIVLVAVIVCGR